VTLAACYWRVGGGPHGPGTINCSLRVLIGNDKDRQKSCHVEVVKSGVYIQETEPPCSCT
jgi:hypothetical protein